MIAVPPPAPFQSASLYVGDLHVDATEGLLFELFSRVGPVASIRVCRDNITRRSLGYAYVNFHHVEDAERALDTMNFTDIKDKQCRIMWSQRDPTLRKTGVGNIFIKNLNKSIDNKSLFDTFSVFGNILSCKVITDEKNESKGFGYVHFETNEAAQEAIKKVDGGQIEGQTVNVILYQRKEQRGGSEWTNLYLKQFPLTWTEDKIKQVAEEFGPTTSIYLAKDGEGNSRGFAFVNFADHESATKAVAGLQGMVHIEDGSGTEFTLYASQAQKKGERARTLKHQMESMKHEKIAKLQGMNVYVKNLDDTITDDELREMFKEFGTITSARVMKDENSATGVSKGFGFVCFSAPGEAEAAVEKMNAKVVQGKPLGVAMHQRREVRQAQLAATFGARAAMAAHAGRGQFGGQQQMYGMPMYGNQQAMGGYGMPRGGFAGRGGGPGYNMPGYMRGPGGMGMRGPQGAMPFGPQGQMPMGGMMMGGRGGRGAGGRGPAGGMPAGRGMMQQGAPGGRGGMQGGMPQGVRFNQQARNQPGVGGHMHPNMMGGQMMGPMGGQMNNMQGQGNMMPPMDNGLAPLDETLLAQAEPQQQKNMIGERLYPLIAAQQGEHAGKITGMLLEMDNAELLHLIESPEALNSKIEEALDVLRKHQGNE